MIKKESPPTIILAALHEAVIAAWQAAFEGVAGVTIHHGSILEVETQAVVCPTNSFGFMLNSLDAAYLKFFGNHIENWLHNRIVTNHHGELLVGQAELIETHHVQIPYFIAAPTMRVRVVMDSMETVNPYLATRGAFLLWQHAVLDDKRAMCDVVKTLALPLMNPGLTREAEWLPPTLCAHQMRVAYDEVLLGKHIPPSTWWEAASKHRQLYNHILSPEK